MMLGMKVVFVIRFLVVIFCLFSSDLFAQTAMQPSFDCTRSVNDVEKKICTDPQLAFADNYLSEIYHRTLNLHLDKNDEIKRIQRLWLTKYRNELCLNDDFSWSDNPEMFDSDDPILRCYKMQIYSLEKLYHAGVSEEFIKKYSDFLVEEYAEYIQQFNHPIYSKQARYFVAKMAAESAVREYLNSERDSLSLVFADTDFLALDRSTFHSETDAYSTYREFYCLQNGDYQRVGNYWSCSGISNKTSILDAMKKKIAQIDLQTQFKLIQEYEAGSVAAEKDETRLVAVLVNFPFLAYDHRVFYSSQAMTWVDDNKELLLPIVKQHKLAVISILNSMLRLNQMIEQLPDGVVLLRNSGGSAYQLREILELDEYTAEEPVAKTLYNLQEVYLHVWAQLYINGGAERAKLTIQHLIEALESDNQ